MKMTLIGALVAAAATMLIGPASAWACDPSIVCERDRLSVENETIPPATTKVVFRADGGEPALPQIIDVASGGAVDVEMNKVGKYYEITFLDPLTPNSDYRLETTQSCWEFEAGSDVTIEFSTGDDVSLPTGLGTLVAGEPRYMDLMVPRMCWEDIGGPVIDLELALEPDTIPWKHALMFETYVNGNLWTPGEFPGIADYPPGASWTGRAQDRLYLDCLNRPDDRVERTVYMKAWLPGTDLTWETNELTLTLDCLFNQEPDEDDTQPGEDDDTEPGEGDGNDDDTEPGEDDDTDSGAGAGQDNTDDEGGCSVAPSGPGTLHAILLGLGVLVFVRRRGALSAALRP